MNYPHDIEAEITFLKAEKERCVETGYRPQFYYDGYDWVAVYSFPDVERVYFGRTITAYVAFMNPQCHSGKLLLGKEILIRDGTNTVGKGRITKILDLEKRAEELIAEDPSVMDRCIRY